MLEEQLKKRKLENNMKRISLIIVLAMIVNTGTIFGGKKGDPFTRRSKSIHSKQIPGQRNGKMSADSRAQQVRLQKKFKKRKEEKAEVERQAAAIAQLVTVVSGGHPLPVAVPVMQADAEESDSDVNPGE